MAVDTDTVDMAVEDTMARDLLMPNLKPKLKLMLITVMVDTEDTVDTVMVGMVDTVMAVEDTMARDLLMPNLKLTVMVVMDMVDTVDTVDMEDTDTTVARGLLKPKPTLTMAVDTDMVMAADTDIVVTVMVAVTTDRFYEDFVRSC